MRGIGREAKRLSTSRLLAARETRRIRVTARANRLQEASVDIEARR